MKMKMKMSVIGNKEEIVEFVKLCQYIQSFGMYGMSRCVHVITDGDGSGKLSFYGEDEEQLPNIPLKDLYVIESQQGKFTIDIGE